MRAPGAILLIACYEMGHQPLTLASPLGTLRRAGYAPVAVDTSVSTLEESAIRAARLVAISVPMHTALRLGTQVAQRVRTLNPTAAICFYGLYASLNAPYLLRTCADATIGGEYEEALLALADALDVGTPLAEAALPGVRTATHAATPVLARLPFAEPARDALPPLVRYAHLVSEAGSVPAGYAEATRGCLHTCAHCPITPVYGGRFFVVPRTVVLADIRRQVAAGARHITFGDPDFLNGPGHTLAVARALHAEHPTVTFDATIKIEHLLRRRALLPELRALGCAFIVSAVESLSGEVLRHLRKGHTRADVVEALELLRAAEIPLRPTFVAFTPWTSAADYLALLDFVAEHDLVEAVDPVQYTIRLLVPPGSALLEDDEARDWLGPLDDAAFSYRWVHPDPRMDDLHARVTHLVAREVAEGTPARRIFQTVRALAATMLDAPPRHEAALLAAAGQRQVPRLSEPWFC